MVRFLIVVLGVSMTQGCLSTYEDALQASGAGGADAGGADAMEPDMPEPCGDGRWMLDEIQKRNIGNQPRSLGPALVSMDSSWHLWFLDQESIERYAFEGDELGQASQTPVQCTPLPAGDLRASCEDGPYVLTVGPLSSSNNDWVIEAIDNGQGTVELPDEDELPDNYNSLTRIQMPDATSSWLWVKPVPNGRDEDQDPSGIYTSEGQAPTLVNHAYPSLATNGSQLCMVSAFTGGAEWQFTSHSMELSSSPRTWSNATVIDPNCKAGVIQWHLTTRTWFALCMSSRDDLLRSFVSTDCSTWTEAAGTNRFAPLNVVSDSITTRPSIVATGNGFLAAWSSGNHEGGNIVVAGFDGRTGEPIQVETVPEGESNAMTANSVALAKFDTPGKYGLAWVDGDEMKFVEIDCEDAP